MPKTIAVVDEDGNVYQPTYPKRARGLVKNGRARWLGENRICLACPPKNTVDLEGNRIMHQEKDNEMAVEATENIPYGQVEQEPAKPNGNEALQAAAVSDPYTQRSSKEEERARAAADGVSLQKLLELLSDIQKGAQHVNQALDVLFSMNDGDSGEAGSPGNLLGVSKAAAIGDVVKCRETTNQMLIRLYEKMYDDVMRQCGLRDDSAAVKKE